MDTEFGQAQQVSPLSKTDDQAAESAPVPVHNRSAHDRAADVVVKGMAARGNARNNLSQQAASTPAPIGPDELVLSRDPSMATAGLLPYFRGRVREKVESWGLALLDPSVHLATDGGAEVVALAWDAAWGTKPIMRDLTTLDRLDLFDPLDAKASVTGTHKLPGWSKVAGDDQKRLDALLGGETNELSLVARNRLRSKFKSLGATTDDQQVTALTAVLTDTAAKPFEGNEHVSNAKINFTLSGPTDVQGYQFSGVKADAEQWHAKYEDGIDVLITAPKAPTEGLHYYSAQEAADAAGYLPKAARALITNLVLNAQVNPKDAYWAVQYKMPDFHAYMNAGADGVVTIFPSSTSLGDANQMQGALQHETGHTWSKRHWGEDTTKGKWVAWKNAMDADKVAVSAYAQASLDEDFAETVKTYLSTQGTPKHAEYQAIVPNRYAILDKEYV